MARFARLVAAAVLTAAAGLAVPLPAQAAACPTTTGVTVVVDFGGVGGGIETTCVPGGGGDSAASLFEVHHNLTRVSRFPGAICKVDGLPGDAGCQAMPPADAYWGLFWSDDGSGWSYSSEGVDSLNIPDGGSVAFAWQNGGGTDAPGAPPASPDEPEPSDPPSGDGPGGDDKGGGDKGGGGGPSGPGDPESSAPGDTPSASPSADPTKPAKGDKTDKPGKKNDDKADKQGDKADGEDAEPAEAEASPSETAEAAPTAEPPAPDADEGLPAWIAPVGIGVLFAAAGVVALVRRRASP